MGNKTARVTLLLAAMLALSACQPAATATPTKPAATPIPPAAKTTWAGDYATHIQPALNEHCVSCHGATRAENGLRLDSYEGVMKGTQFGRIVTPGQPGNSTLVSVLRGTAAPSILPRTPAPSIQMPHQGQRLTSQEVDNIVLWIEAGAPPPK